MDIFTNICGNDKKYECGVCSEKNDEGTFDCENCGIEMCKDCEYIGNSYILCSGCKYELYIQEYMVECEWCKNVWDGNAQCNCYEWYELDEELETNSKEKIEEGYSEEKIEEGDTDSEETDSEERN